jgi:subtilisin-like proprotein convertase family protein
VGGPAGAVTPLPGCPAAWVSGTTYVAGAMVSASGKSFQCHAHPMSLFCGQYQYEPGTALYGKFYKLAWTEVGPCDDKSTNPAVVAPVTATPSCPIDEWMFGVEYIAGSLASKNGQVLKCKTEAVVKYCRQVGFEPFSTKYGGAWMQAWEVIGPCVATAPPPATGGLAPPGVALPTITTLADAITTSSTSTSTTATYTSDRSGSVPDNSDVGLSRPIAVNLPQGAAIKKISVTVNMIHTAMNDMVINLKAPNGKVLNLFHRVDGINMVDTVISSTGTSAFNSRIASFTDTYTATAAIGVGPTGFESNVVNFDDLYATPSGDWILALRDKSEGDSGTLNGWKIAFEFD